VSVAFPRPVSRKPGAAADMPVRLRMVAFAFLRLASRSWSWKITNY
jgi:hypothetical protein